MSFTPTSSLAKTTSAGVGNHKRSLKRAALACGVSMLALTLGSVSGLAQDLVIDGGATLDASGSDGQTYDNIVIGTDSGDGTLSLTNGTASTLNYTNTLTMGSSLSDGHIVVSGAGSILNLAAGATATNALNIGDVKVTDGGVLNFNQTVTFNNTDITVSGAGSQFNIVTDSILRVYDGRLTVADGGSVSAVQLLSERSAVLIDGGTVHISSRFVPAFYSSVVVQNQGRLTSDYSIDGAFATIVVQSGGQIRARTIISTYNDYFVDGSGSRAEATGGFFAAQTLSVSNGGAVVSADGSKAFGDWSIDGPGSSVHVGSDFQLNDHAVTVSNGGTLSVGRNWTTGGTLNIGAAADDTAAGAGTVDGNINAPVHVVFNHTDNNYNFDPLLSGGADVNAVSGRTIFAKNETYTGGTVIGANGELQLGNGGNKGSITGNVVNDGLLAFNRSDQVDFAGSISGSGRIEQDGTNTLTLSGDNSAFTGITSVNDGTLMVDGVLGGTVSNVAGGSAIGGEGTILGNLNVGAGGTLLGDSRHVLTVDGNLVLDNASKTDVVFDQPGQSGVVHVLGDLTLGGVLDISNQNGQFGAGLYRVFDYDGTLTDNGMVLGSVNGGVAGQFGIFTTVNHQVNLVYTGSGVPLRFWDGGNPANHGNGQIDGGDGIWTRASNGNWADAQATNMDWANDSFAIFGGQAGTVTVDDSAGAIDVDGIQFAADGYKITGDAVTLDGTTDQPVIRVQQNASAIIESELRGTRGLKKSDYGTLVLTGENTYSGGTTVSEGILQIGNGGTTGSILGDVTLDQTAYDTGRLAFDRSDLFNFTGNISGAGSVIQAGSGTTVLTGTNTYADGTTILAGTLQVGNGTTSGSITGDVDIQGGALAFSHSDDIAFAGQISGVGQVVQRGSGVLTLSGDNSFSGGLTVESGFARAGIVDHAFGSGVLTVNAGAQAELADFNTTTGGLSGAGNVALGSATLKLRQDVATEFSGVINGTGGLTKEGTGVLTLSGADTYTGATTVNDGVLKQGAAEAFNTASSSYDTSGDGALDLNGFNTTIAAMSNGGRVNFGGSGGTLLAVNGNYTGNGGMMVMNTVLGNDSSKTDLLHVAGNTSGSTSLLINNAGGVGAQTSNGIKIIDVGGQSNGDFTLANSYTTKDGQQAVVGGAYAYTLQHGGVQTPADGNWYLVSSLSNPVNPDCEQTNSCPPNPPAPRYGAGVPVYEGYAQNMMTLNKLPTLQQRVGDRYWSTPHAPQSNDHGAAGKSGRLDDYGMWARVESAHNRLNPSTSTSRMKQDVNSFIMQAGVDGQFYEDESGKLIAGISGQYGHAKGDVSSFFGDGSISTDAWSLGANATWYGNNGFYVDGQGQVTWFDNDLDSWTANAGLAQGRKATGYALSLEAGQRMAISGNWTLTPQAQLMWSKVDANAFQDIWGSHVSLHDGDSLTGRVGLAASYSSSWKGNDGLMVNTNVYGIANLYQEFLGGTVVNVSGVNFNTDNDRTWAGLGAGGTYAWANNKYALYGEGSINTGLNNFADSYTLKGNLGFKVKW